MTKDLFLKYKFTDRGGRDAYEIYEAEDNKRLSKPLGGMRIARHAGTELHCKAEIVWGPLADSPEGGEPEQLELDLQGGE